MQKLILSCIVAAVISQTSFACIDIAVTKGASANKSCMLAMTDDANDRDPRIIRIPARDYKPGDKRPIYSDNRVYPRYNIKDGVKYYYTPEYKLSEPVGYIDQVSHTYAYFDAIYPMMNEHQLSMAESTCGSKKGCDFDKNKRILEVKDLMRIGLERCKSSHDAVRLFGELVKKYGYYGGAENVLIADPNEIWNFEIAGVPSGNAVWVAQRIPDGEVFVSANHFRIREINKDSNDYMYSDNLFDECVKAGWYNPEKDKVFDWLKVISDNKEPGYPYCNMRRVWRVFDLLAPSKKFSPWVEDAFSKDYPFSVKPDRKVEVKDIQRCLRDWYQGTEFDLSKGAAAGPFGVINRYTSNDSNNKGNWERAISTFKCIYTFITQSRADLPDMIGGLMWFGFLSPHATCYVPFYCGIGDLPEAYQTGDNRHLDRSSAFWAFNYVMNILEIKFSYMIKDIQKKQNEIESKEFRMQPIIEAAAMKAYSENPELAREYLTDYCETNANRVYNEWWKFGDSLITRYQNGFIVDEKSFTSPGYSEEWLKSVNFKPLKYKKETSVEEKQKPIESDKVEH